ncbi:hypothetical protein [Nisaea sp.]|uniref:hypothetical protein n=1 Tax=Nisaea sp. TaxID=2024842 RepID=UPI003B52FC2D
MTSGHDPQSTEPPTLPTATGTLARFLESPRSYALVVPTVNVCVAATGLFIPWFMEPVSFGQFILISTFVQYLWLLDLGTSQLITRTAARMKQAGMGKPAGVRIQGMLWTRFYLAAIAITSALLLAYFFRNSFKVPLPMPATLLAITAGGVLFILMGHLALYRGLSNYVQFTANNAIAQVGLTVPRVLGLFFGGLSGCFSVLILWFGGIAVNMLRRDPLDIRYRPSVPRVRRTIVVAFPLFVSVSLWSFFMMANRWFVAQLADPETYGQFSFAAAVLGLYAGTFGTIAQAYYPKLSAEAYAAEPFALSPRVVNDALKLALVISVLSSIGVLTAKLIVPLVYSAYAEAVPALKIFLVAGIPMIMASWLMPIAMSARTRPSREIVTVYLLAIGTLWAGTVIGYRMAELEGVGVGVIVASYVMLGGQAILLRRSRVLSIRDAARLVATVVLLSGSVALLSVYVAP